jgi:hypothetical protein
VRSVNVLVRPHPYNFHRWADRPVADLTGVAVYPGQSYNPLTPDSRNDFYDSISHAAAVVGINTSAMVEAAIIGRPVCSMLAEEFTDSQEGTIHFRHLLPEHGGFLRIAATLDAHVAQLGLCLQHPDQTRAETARFVASFIRPHGVDRPATPIFVDAVEALAAGPAPEPEAASVSRYLLRPVVLLATVPVLIDDWIREPGRRQRLRKQASSWSKRSVKRLSKARHRWKKYLQKAL